MRDPSCAAGGAGLAGVLSGLGSGMIRGPYACWQLGQVLHLARLGSLIGQVGKAVEPAAPAPAGLSLDSCPSGAAVRADAAEAGRRQERRRAAGAHRTSEASALKT